MPVITTEKITGLAHCTRQVKRANPCYPQHEVEAIRETVEYLYSDGHGGMSADPIDATFARLVERSVSYIHFANPEDAVCPVCGGPREVTDQVRPDYAALSGVPQDELIDQNERAAAAAVTTADAATRQAIALEALVQQGQQAGEAEQLREVVERQSAQIDALLARLDTEPANGHSRRKRAES